MSVLRKTAPHISASAKHPLMRQFPEKYDKTHWVSKDTNFSSSRNQTGNEAEASSVLATMHTIRWHCTGGITQVALHRSMHTIRWHCTGGITQVHAHHQVALHRSMHTIRWHYTGCCGGWRYSTHSLTQLWAPELQYKPARYDELIGAMTEWQLWE
jgi:hypothetical protein